MTTLNPLLFLIGRLLLAAIFLQSGFNKIFGYASTAQGMEAKGIPGLLLPVVILVEFAGGAGIVLGWKTFWSALALAGFTLVAAYFYHLVPDDQNQMIHFMKNMTIVGGLLVLAAAGPGAWSVEGRR